MNLLNIQSEQGQHHQHDMNYNEPCVVLIYANWCPHCQVMEPEWNNATDAMEKNVKVIKIESNDLPEYQDMLHSHGAHSNGYPTIYAFKPGEEPEYYGGERNEEGFISWVNKLFGKNKSVKKKRTQKKKGGYRLTSEKQRKRVNKGHKKSGGYRLTPESKRRKTKKKQGSKKKGSKKQPKNIF